MNLWTMLAACVSLAGMSVAQHPPSAVDPTDYLVFAQGANSSFEAMIAAAAEADVIVIGEQHNHKLGHALKLDILRALYARNPNLALSLEMFERDVQLILNEYLAGHITEQHFLQSARPWPNYRTDYRPLVEFCRENRLPVIAANAPRRYVNIVSRKGQEALKELPKESKAFLPRLPFSMDIPAGYAKQLDEIFGASHDQPSGAQTGAASSGQARPANRPSPENMKQAQGLWDATMADSILRFRRASRGRKVIQVNGAMHSDSWYGLVDRLRKAAPRLKIALITIKPDSAFPNVSMDKYALTADYILLTRPDPTTGETGAAAP
jgi:uncharacterized iron-regulated protein